MARYVHVHSLMVSWCPPNNLSMSIGKYAYTNELGSTIIVRYSVHPNNGFIIENDIEVEKQLEEAIENVVLAKMVLDAFDDLF